MGRTYKDNSYGRSTDKLLRSKGRKERQRFIGNVNVSVEELEEVLKAADGPL